MRIFFVLILLSHFSFSLSAQEFSPPLESDSIVLIPSLTKYSNQIVNGPAIGDTIKDFTCYNNDGVEFNLYNELKKGKPVMLISGSYTCPRFRNSLPLANLLNTKFTKEFNTFILYGFEAHPIVDTCIYFRAIKPTKQNMAAKILFEQPKTYGERKNIITEMTNNFNISPPILIDDVKNTLYFYFGPAPNKAFLIDTNGVVILKHQHFNSYPRDIIHDLDKLLKP